MCSGPPPPTLVAVSNDPSVTTHTSVDYWHIDYGYIFDNLGLPGVLYIKNDQLVYELLTGLSSQRSYRKEFSVHHITNVEVFENSSVQVRGARRYLQLQLNPGLRITVNQPGSNTQTITARMQDAQRFGGHLSQVAALNSKISNTSF